MKTHLGILFAQLSWIFFVNGERPIESVAGKLCRGPPRITVGFCVDQSEDVSEVCVGKNVVIQRSADCGIGNWCCLGSDEFVDVNVPPPPPPPIKESFVVPSGGHVAQNGVFDAVDNAPCGLGNTLRSAAGDSSVISSIRRFARVYKGVLTEVGDFCWVAALFDAGDTKRNIPQTFVCAATIINSTHILTAGHCVDRYLSQPSRLIVQTGTDSASTLALTDPSSCAQQLPVVEIILSQRYDPDNLLEDHALLRVAGTIRADGCTCRVCLPDRTVTRDTTNVLLCWVAGFGSTTEGAASSLQLTKSPIAFVRRDICEVTLGKLLSSGVERLPLPDSAFCAGDAQHGGLCTNDGGAPLTCLIGGRHTILGVGSWSIDCSQYPSVFSSISACSGFFSNADLPCSAKKSALRPTFALTDLSSGPTCGLPGTSDIDPFRLAKQSRQNQLAETNKVKAAIQELMESMEVGRPTSAPTIATIGEDTVPASLNEQNFGDADERLLPAQFRRSMMVAAESPISVAGQFPESSVVGGQPVPKNQVCWQVLVSSGCGGSIISDQHILTAAHCVTQKGTKIPKDLSQLKVVLGASISPVKFPLDGCQEIRNVRRVYVHPDYFLGNDSALYVSSDIAIIELASPIDFSKPCVCRVCLQDSEPAAGETCTITGFGCQEPTKPGSPCSGRGDRALQKLNVVMPGDDVCSTFFQGFPSDKVTCSASGLGRAPCFGDSGGPIVCYNNERNTHYQAGVTSFAIFPDGANGCGSGNNNFQYYTKVKHFIPWIQRFVPDVMVTVPSRFLFQASFNIDLGDGVSNIVTNNQLLPAQ
ncbi:hypothetical protein RvY_19270 [Ramazzottius varieornatus]|uniref:Peptidase S1 domain-containing protein n=1 Tax=Ramazzottius varieornatus TaxID=947166 RepID=A0A1D1W8U8_RAMVA|nr:hypothetical protein RvY_19270 [Ramazzottius varieornatus]